MPFKGDAEANAAVLGNHTMLQADGTGWRPLVDAGKLRLLMIWTAKRSKNWPDVPTLKELGYPFVFDSPFGIAGPKGMDPKVVAKLHDAFKKAIEDPAVLETLAKFDMVRELQEHRGLPQVRHRGDRVRTQGGGQPRPQQEVRRAGGAAAEALAARSAPCRHCERSEAIQPRASARH